MGINDEMIAGVAVPEDVAKHRYAIIISGDGLQPTMTTELAGRLADRGIATAWVKALKYFWSARSPRSMSKDMERQLRRRLKRHPNDSILLIGYSFGAGTLAFAINRLPEDLILKIDGAAILAPPASADFKFFFRSWFNKSTKHALDTAPEIERLSQKIPVIYLRGTDDYIGPSDVLKPSEDLTIMVLPGGHDFDQNYDHLVHVILEAIPPR